MKKLFMLLFVLMFLYTCAKEPSQLEQSLYGQWNGEYDAASVYFSKDHKMYVEGLGIVMEKMKWKVQEETAASKKIQVYVYDYVMTEDAKRMLKQFSAYAAKDRGEQRYPTVYTYVLNADGTLDVYDDKGKKTEVLHRTSDAQEPAGSR